MPAPTPPQFSRFYYLPRDEMCHGLVSDAFVFRKGNGILIIIEGLNMWFERCGKNKESETEFWWKNSLTIENAEGRYRNVSFESEMSCKGILTELAFHCLQFETF